MAQNHTISNDYEILQKFQETSALWFEVVVHPNTKMKDKPIVMVSDDSK